MAFPTFRGADGTSRSNGGTEIIIRNNRLDIIRDIHFIKAFFSVRSV